MLTSPWPLQSMMASFSVLCPTPHWEPVVWCSHLHPSSIILAHSSVSNVIVCIGTCCFSCMLGYRVPMTPHTQIVCCLQTFPLRLLYPHGVEEKQDFALPEGNAELVPSSTQKEAVCFLLQSSPGRHCLSL